MFTVRKWWLPIAAALLLLSPSHLWADGLLQNRFLAAGAGTPIDNIGTAIGFHKLTWNVSGTASVCTVALDTSTDGITWSAGGAIAGQTCTSNGTSTVATVVANYVRMNMTALTVTAGSSVSVTWTGYVNNPSGGGGTIAGSITATHLVQASAGNTAADVVGSSVTTATGAIALTAGADTTTPLTVNSHSATQSVPVADFSNQSTVSPGAAFNFRGAGLGSFNGSPSTVAIGVEDDTPWHLSFTNKASVAGIVGFMGLGSTG